MKYYIVAYALIASSSIFGGIQQSSLAGESTPVQPQNADYAQNTEIVTFKAPQGWQYAESTSLPPSVKVMVVGKGANEFPPSINLGTEAYTGTLKNYLKRIKEINDSQKHSWKDLGTINTDSGEASLSQVDSVTKWGNVKMMHVILLKDNTIYILTAAALKEEFSKFYKDFFAAFRSLKVSPSENTQYSNNDTTH